MPGAKYPMILYIVWAIVGMLGVTCVVVGGEVYYALRHLGPMPGPNPAVLLTVLGLLCIMSAIVGVIYHWGSFVPTFLTTFVVTGFVLPSQSGNAGFAFAIAVGVVLALIVDYQACSQRAIRTRNGDSPTSP